MGLDVSSFQDAIKEHYSSDEVRDLTMQNNVVTSLIEKESYEGTPYRLPVKWGNPQGISPSFTQAQTLAGTTNTRVAGFDLTNTKMYGVCQWDTEVLKTAKSNVGAFMRARTAEMDGLITGVGKKLEWFWFGNGYGKIGVVGSSTGSTITLATITDSHAFEVGMEVVFSESESGHVLRDSGDELVVTNVNRSTGVITFSQAVSTITGLANSDTIFLKGARQDSATPSRLVTAGFEAWLPTSAPSSTAFYTIDRSVDSRLYGLSYDGSSADLEDALIEGIMRVAQVGGKLDTYLISYTKYSTLIKRMHDLKRYVDVKVTADVGFRGVEIQGPHGPVAVMPSWACPVNRAFGLQKDTWKILHLDSELVNILDDDGNPLRRRDASDAWELRALALPVLGCSAPGYNINVQL